MALERDTNIYRGTGPRETGCLWSVFNIQYLAVLSSTLSLDLVDRDESYNNLSSLAKYECNTGGSKV
jgi:hypothetical protein